MMTNFLVWNTNKKPLNEIIVQLVKEHEVDVLLLIEPNQGATSLLSRLNNVGPFQVVESQARFRLLTKFDSFLIERIKPFIEDKDKRSDYWHLKLPGRADVLLVGIHGYDMINYQQDAREMLLARVAENIKFIEDNTTRHKRTIVFGDFNANPYDSAVGSLRGLHALQIPSVAGKPSRPHAEQQHEFFYNPMWAHLGSGGGKPPATYYYYKYRPHEVFWHMLDQVVLRPAALPLFPEGELKIIHEVAGSSLLKADGTPDAKLASDHLPLFFRLDLKKGGTDG